ncbi:glutamyl-tRNA reductase [Candidatus Gracilibacteria bacterium]|nr:glutamyl-tRNA reductase [Candidatus Gracilibacteria bacterium]
MNLLLAGLDHTTAPVEIRERLAFNSADIPAALMQLTSGSDGRAPLFREAVLLSTCNRVEIYGVIADGSTADAVVDFLASFHGLERHDFASSLYFVRGEAVVQHLCATAAGLRSLVLGEAQIQGQVRLAYEQAKEIGSAGTTLSHLFRQALSAGKRVRHETPLGCGAASVSQAGVELARQRFGELKGHSVLLIGGGEVSELAAQNLLANGADRLTIVNRTLARGRELAERYHAEAIGFEQLPDALGCADIVISSTAAPVPIIYREHIADALAAHNARGAWPSMLLIDLAVPRDIAPECGQLPGVHLCTVDDLQEVVSHTIAQRHSVVDVADAIVTEEADYFLAWLRSLDAMPMLTSLRQRAEALRSAELARALRMLPALSAEQQTVLEGFSRSLVNKLLHTPTVRVRDAAEHGDGQRYAAMLRDLFNLEATT